MIVVGCKATRAGANTAIGQPSVDVTNKWVPTSWYKNHHCLPPCLHDAKPGSMHSVSLAVDVVRLLSLEDEAARLTCRVDLHNQPLIMDESTSREAGGANCCYTHQITATDCL